MSRVDRVAGLFTAMDVAASGLTAERGRMNIIASNLANARTTSGPDGGPYRRLDPIFASRAIERSSRDAVLSSVHRVELVGVEEDPNVGQVVYEPDHPDADAGGYVEYPNVNVVTEMVNLMTASHAYEAGVVSIEALKSMAHAAIKIGQ